MKSLERRLASVLTQAFDDCPTLRGRFRLLDCFSDLVHRPAIAEELQRKHAIMVQDFATEVGLVKKVRSACTRLNPKSPRVYPCAEVRTMNQYVCRNYSDPLF